ncbi:MAG TPA: acyl-CoA dehydrogenase family protein [Candidatus Baltobacteraceae bacterium]|nr:acyl-CoA dehydrogenase family protein [Candidatus Baltobacteraceae bacterium]
MATHVVENQPPPLENYNVFSSNRVLMEALAREAPGASVAELRELGALAGKPETIALGFEANEHVPELRTHDRFGHRIDEVQFHPAWHDLMRVATAYGLHGTPWEDEQPYPHVRRAAKFFVWSHVESGHGCPISMTYAAVPAVRLQPEIAAAWVPAFARRAYDPNLAPIAEKASALCGMGMTEKQGGSDVRANTTCAVPALRPGAGSEYLLTGHKWFCSAPMCDAFLVLAQAAAGLSCFFVPRVLPDGTRNPFSIQRLKRKLGNRSNASSEIELDATHGWLIGEEGRGVQTIVEMVNHTRLDCIVGSAGLVHEALVQAIHHATYRSTFGAPLIDRPLMQNVLADISLESEAAIALFMRLARAIDDAPLDEHAAALKRIGTAIGKYYVCKRAPGVVGEALECLGGNGYVEESIVPRLYREAPVNSIWEGSGNINALDVLRIVRKQPESLAALRAEIEPVASDARIRAALTQLERDLADVTALESRARSVTERLALLWQASLLMQHAPQIVADAFVDSRIATQSGRTMGTLPASANVRSIVERASPHGVPVPA